MQIQELHERIKEAATRGTPVPFTLSEAEALVELAEAAKVVFETTIDRNVARRRMEGLQVALARLERA